MIIVVRMILARWDDCGEEINQEEAAQDVADEVSEEVDSRGKLGDAYHDDVEEVVVG